MKSLIDVDVSQACNERLIEKGRFQNSPGSSQAVSQDPGSHFEGVRSQSGPEPSLKIRLILGGVEPPESTGVDKVQGKPI